MTTTPKRASQSPPPRAKSRSSGMARGALFRNMGLAGVFGLCVFLAAVGPIREREQGALARAQYERDATLAVALRRLKDPRLGYLNAGEPEFSSRVQDPITPWGALTRAEALPFGVGFFIEHAFSSKDACVAYVELATDASGFDRVLVDGKTAYAKLPAGAPELPGSSLCSSNGQNALRLIAMDPGAAQANPRRAADAPAPQNSRIPGGYLTPKALPATPEQLREAERAKAAAP